LKGKLMVKLKAGIIGAGGIAQYAHIPCYKKLGDVEISAIADVNVEKLEFVARKYGVPKTFARWEDMLDENIDIVSICSPTAFHYSQAIRAMERGKHVLCEKPVCIDTGEAEEIFRVSKRTGMKFMAAMHKRFSGESIALKKIIEAGILGEIYYVKTGWTRRRGMPNPGSWFTHKELSGGGSLMDIGVHAIDLAVYLAGLSNPVSISGSSYSKFRDNASDGGWPPLNTRKGNEYAGSIDVEELAAGFTRFKNGQTLFAEACWAGNLYDRFSLEIMGDRAGAAIFDPGEKKKNSLAIYRSGQPLSDIFPSVSPVDPFMGEIEYFIKCVREDTEPLTKADEIITVIRIIRGIYESSETGYPAKISIG